MLRQHRSVLNKNHEFLLGEVPVDETLEALRPRNILTWHDFDQLKSLRHQGRRALVRYLLAILPYRGNQAFDGFLESLQEANAQHIVDLLLENVDETIHTPAVDEDGNPQTPSDTPLPTHGPDPHEYAVRLTRNDKLIREYVEPHLISPVLLQNKVMSAREADMVAHLHGGNKKWDLIMAVLLQRGERAYQAFMAALLQHGYSRIFHTIQETSTELSGSDSEPEELQENNKPVNDVDDEVPELESDDEEPEALRREPATDADPNRRDLQSSASDDEPPFATSRDPMDGNGNPEVSPTETDDRLSADTDLDGYIGFEEDNVSDGRASAKSNTSKSRRNPQRKGNGSPALQSVKEEPEEPSPRNESNYVTNAQ